MDDDQGSNQGDGGGGLGGKLKGAFSGLGKRLRKKSQNEEHEPGLPDADPPTQTIAGYPPGQPQPPQQQPPQQQPPQAQPPLQQPPQVQPPQQQPPHAQPPQAEPPEQQPPQELPPTYSDQIPPDAGTQTHMGQPPQAEPPQAQGFNDEQPAPLDGQFEGAELETSQEPFEAPPSDEPAAFSESDGNTGKMDAVKAKVSNASELLKQGFRRGFRQKPDLKQIGKFIEKGQAALEGEGVGKAGKYLALILCAYFVSDVAGALMYRYIPAPKPVKAKIPKAGVGKKKKDLNAYNKIFARNLVNSAGKIPGESANVIETPKDETPVRTKMQINLIGTVILENESFSVAAIQDRSAGRIYPVRSEDEIPGKMKVASVEAARVVFRNLRNRRLEFIDMPKDKSGLGKIRTKPKSTGPKVKKVSATNFQISREEIDSAMANLNQLLTQARAVPNFEGGVPAGYKLFQIAPGSIYQKLGMLNGDVISQVNGDDINDPAKAFELLTELKTSNHVEVTIKRGGKDVTMSYDIN